MYSKDVKIEFSPGFKIGSTVYTEFIKEVLKYSSQFKGIKQSRKGMLVSFPSLGQNI
jgi:hypothetical protein